MHRALWLTALLVTGAACESTQDGVFIREADLPAKLEAKTKWSTHAGPVNNSHENHTWYLEYIRNRALEQGKITIAQLCEDRVLTAHPFHTEEQSWTRIQLAYWLSRIDEWTEVTQKLSGVPGNPWSVTPYKPPNAPDVTKSAAMVLDDVMTKLIGSGQVVETDKLVAPSTTKDRIEYRKSHIYTSYSSSTTAHSFEAAWMHTWMALQYAQIPPATTPPGSLAPEWTICEIDHN
jgi:hypothetical protein